MTKIGLISDTHSFIDEAIIDYLKDCDEVWHAGDFGSIELVEDLKKGLLKNNNKGLIKGVYGNIDSSEIRQVFPEKIIFDCEQVRIMIQHIGGYPGRYSVGVKKEIIDNKIKLFISGHSHILKIMYDDKLGCLHMNPGAAGKHGWHKTRTIIRFVIDKNDIKDCEVIELCSR